MACDDRELDFLTRAVSGSNAAMSNTITLALVSTR
jgi:hypothetical protein